MFEPQNHWAPDPSIAVVDHPPAETDANPSSGVDDEKSERYSLFLATGKGNALLANKRFVTCIKYLEITLQGASSYNGFVPLLVEGGCKQDVLFDCVIDKPCLLRTVSNTFSQTCQWIRLKLLCMPAEILC